MSGPSRRPAEPRPLVLASASPRRRELLATLGRPFTVQAADLDESLRPGEAPDAYGARLALAKAGAVAAGLGAAAATVVGADTLVVLEGAILGKPADEAEATAMLRRLRGRAHQVITALAVLDARSGRHLLDCAWTRVQIRDYGEAELAAYVAGGDPLDKAGAYAIQHAGFRPVARLEGSETNVIGLPLGLLAKLLGWLEQEL